jgi:hypothetical protein
LGMLNQSIEQGKFDELDAVLERLDGRELKPESERALLICGGCRALMKHPGFDALPEDGLKDLLARVQAEYHDVMEAWGLELLENSVTAAARRARLAPTREDHWMNRQGDRLRQAIDRKMKFTVTLLKVLGLAQTNKPTSPKRRRKTRRAATRIRRVAMNVA